MDCLFCRIIANELPSQRVYEDEHVVAFKDKFPKADVHVLVVPRRHMVNLWDIDTAEDIALMGHLMGVLPKIAKQIGLSSFRTILNSGATSGQEIFHLHAHILGGSKQLPGF